MGRRSGEPKLLSRLVDSCREHKALRQTSALFVKNALVAWRNRWATGLRLLAPLLFLAMALMVQEVMDMNARATGRTKDVPNTTPVRISSIPACSSELFIYDKPCLDFVYTPKNNSRVQAVVAAIQRHNEPPIPDSRVMGFNSRSEADDFMQSRHKFVLGAVHFSEAPGKQLQYILQSNTSIPTFKGYVQSPNDFFQMPFMSAVAREISRHYLEAAGRTGEAASLQWAPQMAYFPHPQLSPGTSGYILPPFIFVACMFATISFLAVLVSEKESGLRQALQTMGLQQGSYWLSWWLFEAVMAAITAWCLIGFGAALRLSMFTANNVMLQFLLFWLFGLAMTSFACCTSVFLQTSQSAGNASLAMILVGWVCQALAAIGMPYSPSIFFTSNGMGKAFFWVFSLFPWNPLTKAVLDMSAAATNASQHGLRFADRHSYCKYVPDPSRIATGADMSWLYLDNNCIFSLEQCYWVLLVQAVAWMAAAVYFDNVQPNKHGVRLPFWYPLVPRYWANLCRSAGSTLQARAGRVGSQGGSASSQGGTRLTPFAAPDAARKVAKSIADVKAHEEQLVIRCSSSAGGGTLEAVHSRANGGLPGHASVASTARQSVSSGFLRRRDNRNSGSGLPDASGRDSCAGSGGELGPMPSRSATLGSTVGRLPQFGAGQQQQQQQQQQAGGSTHLVINSSVTALRLSESSSEATTMGHHHSLLAGGGAAVAVAAAGASVAPGTTISLQQYQQMQADKGSSSTSSRRWWGAFWGRGEASLALAAKKHDSMLAAAAAAGSPASAVLQQQQQQQQQQQGKDMLSAGPAGAGPVVLDPGVLQEEQRMKAALYGEGAGAWTPKQDLIQVFGLRKVYSLPGARRWWQFWKRTSPGHQQAEKRQYVAVVDSWFGVPKGQLLCLLGPNGAGKTTSINCLIGALPPSGGDVRVMGHSLLAPDGLEVAQGVMGVCPQFDVLWDELSGMEHMYIYGCIKGLPSSEVVDKGAGLLEQVQLTFAAQKRSSSYSGGMKRRLSVALALLGSPQLVFLDEPSTGMDPISRRAVWDAIDAAKQQAAVVLTTHSMEEADALGDRIGIMVRGRMRVLGGSLTLKQKYGNGYQLRLRLLDSTLPASLAEQQGNAEQLPWPGSQEQQPGSQQQQQQQEEDQQEQQQQQQQQMLLPKAAVVRHSSFSIRELTELFESRAGRSSCDTGSPLHTGAASSAFLRRTNSNNSRPGSSAGMAPGAAAREHRPQPSMPQLPATPRAGAAADAAAAAAAATSGAGAGSSADAAGTTSLALSAATPGDATVLQQLVADQLGLTPTEEGRQMLHYVIPQMLAPQLQVLLELLDSPDKQRQLGLAEVHVSLATLEEVFLTVVKQAEQDYAALHGQTVRVELPASGRQLELPVGQEVAVDPTTGHVYAIDWAQDEWGKLAVAGVREMSAAEQHRYWQSRHLVH